MVLVLPVHANLGCGGLVEAAKCLCCVVVCLSVSLCSASVTESSGMDGLVVPLSVEKDDSVKYQNKLMKVFIF